MGKEKFLELLKECIKEGLIDFEFEKSSVYYKEDIVKVIVDGEVIKQISH
ncbi:MAG: hypothetical protein ACOCRX_01285 [Candidatus Woesearchaeota archaeon]